MSKFSLLTALSLILGLTALAGCPSTVGDDDSASTPELCDVEPGCQSSNECPADQPAAGDACTFTGNCHYCDPDSAFDEAEGFSCDGAVFAYQGSFLCE